MNPSPEAQGEPTNSDAPDDFTDDDGGERRRSLAGRKNTSADGGDREAVRNYVTTTANKFTTVLGDISFDANGDTSQHVISEYKFDPTTKDWKYFQQKDYTSGVTTTAAP